MFVIPGMDLIVCWNDSKITGRDMENHALSLLMKSVSKRTLDF
jgi:hypothetical protein